MWRAKRAGRGNPRAAAVSPPPCCAWSPSPAPRRRSRWHDFRLTPGSVKLCRSGDFREGSTMKYDVISADCHVDLIWLPPDLFTDNAAASFKDRMPYVTDGPRGREWVTQNGASFGLDAGMGSAG